MDEIARLVRQAESQYHRLAMVVGEAGAGKTRLLRHFSEVQSVPLVKVGLELSRALLEEPGEERAVRALESFTDLIRDSAQTAVLDDIEILFSPALELRVLALLKRTAVSRTLVVAWPGRLEDGELQYAVPSHPEHYTAEWSGPIINLNDR